MAETKVDWPSLMNEALTAPGSLGNTYSRFHDYSIGNMMLFLFQGLHEPVASASTWKSLGRQITNWSARSEVIVPRLITEKPPEDESGKEKRERVSRLIGFKVVRAVFPLSATEGDELPEVKTLGWDLQTALSRLGIKQAVFESTNGNLQGYSHGLEFAINPVAANPTKTRFHELAHIVLGHTLPHHFEEYQAHRGVLEFQAEATAYLCMNELEVMDDETASVSRAYIKHWLADEQPPDQAIRQVFVAVDRILRSGRITEGA